MASSGGREHGREPYRVFLKALSAKQDRFNDIDRWLVDLARADGRPDELDRRDFIRAMPDVAVAGFLTAAQRYVQKRCNAGDRSEDVASEFLDAVSRLEMPPRYTVLMVYGNSDISGIRHGRLVGYVSLGTASATSKLAGFDLDWDISTRSIGIESLWAWNADPYAGRRLLLYLGIGVEGMRGNGKLTDIEGTAIGEIDYFGFRVGLFAHARYAVAPWLTGYLAFGSGFGIGTLRVAGSPRESLGVEDPCNINLTDLQTADDAVRCTITNALGFYDTFPLTLRLGAQLFGWLNLEGTWSHEPLYRNDTQISPDAVSRLSFTVGVNIY